MFASYAALGLGMTLLLLTIIAALFGSARALAVCAAAAFALCVASGVLLHVSRGML